MRYDTFHFHDGSTESLVRRSSGTAGRRWGRRAAFIAPDSTRREDLRAYLFTP